MKIYTLSLIFGMLLALGCSDDPSPPEGEDATPITFTLINSTDSTLFAGRSAGDSECSSAPFLRVQGADATPKLQTGCGDCVCGEGPCVSCDCAQATRSDFEFAPGETRTFTWDKRFWSPQSDETPVCQAPAAASLSDYVAEFCFSDSYNDDGLQPGRQLCKNVAFDIEDENVALTLEDQEVPTNTTELRVVNETGEPIFVREGPGSCYGTWLELSTQNESISLFEACGIRDCSEAGSDFQQACPDAACRPPQRSDWELLDGEARSFVWDHTYWPQRELGGDVCEYPSYIVGPMTAKLCFARTLDESNGGAELVDETCETLQFNTDESRVELVVD